VLEKNNSYELQPQVSMLKKLRVLRASVVSFLSHELLAREENGAFAFAPLWLTANS